MFCYLEGNRFCFGLNVHRCVFDGLNCYYLMGNRFRFGLNLHRCTFDGFNCYYLERYRFFGVKCVSLYF